MTKNQIEYWSLQERREHNTQTRAEAARANRAKEAETNRSNMATERETNRSNVVRETETARANLAKEAETFRHNIASEQVQLGALNETIRSNYAREQEAARHNVAVEQEQYRSNVAREQETSRANRASEQLSSQRNSLQAQANAITASYNQKLAEHNVVLENLQNKKIQADYQLGKGSERQREASLDMQAAAQSETARHNLAQERISSTQTVSGLIGSAINAAGRVIGGSSLLKGRVQ